MSLEGNLGRYFPDKAPEITTLTSDPFSLVRNLISKNRFAEARKYFGPKSLGQIVFDFIIAGTTCESYEVDPEGNKIICEKVAAGSVDFDAGGIGDVVLVCSKECFEKTAASIKEQTNAIGRPTAIGRNGFGRH